MGKDEGNTAQPSAVGPYPTAVFVGRAEEGSGIERQQGRQLRAL